MSEEKCEHVANDTVSLYARLTSEITGKQHLLCQPCFFEFLSKEGHDPQQPIGYHLYRSSDPSLPKSQWTRLTDFPIPDSRFRDTTGERGAVYYYYVTSVNAYGLESDPSEVICGGMKPLISETEQ